MNLYTLRARFGAVSCASSFFAGAFFCSASCLFSGAAVLEASLRLRTVSLQNGVSTLTTCLSTALYCTTASKVFPSFVLKSSM